MQTPIRLAEADTAHNSIFIIATPNAPPPLFTLPFARFPPQLAWGEACDAT